MSKEKIGTLSLILCATIWGLAFVFVTKAIDAGWQTFPILAFRGLVGGLVMLPFAIKNKFYRYPKTILLSMINGIIFFAAYSLQTVGQGMSGSDNSAFITSLNVVFIPLILHFILRQRIKPKVYLASVLAFSGAGLISLKGEFVLNIGDVFLLLCAVCFAVQIIFTKKCMRHTDPLSLTSLSLLTMGILSLIAMPISGQMQMHKEGLVSVIFLAVFSSAIASVLQFFGQKYVPTSKASLILCQESVLAVVFGALIYWEMPSLFVIFGGLLMILGVIIVEVDFKRKSDDNKNISNN